MNISLKYDVHSACKAILRQQLDKLHIPYKVYSSKEIEIERNLTAEETEMLVESLGQYNMQVLSCHKTDLVQRIKNAIEEMLVNDLMCVMNVSSYLADQLNYSYAHLSSLFSEAAHTSIESFVILRKIDHAKELMLTTNLTLTEIAYRLNYCSVAHLSNQFKKTTGFTPTQFQKIVKMRRENHI